MGYDGSFNAKKERFGACCFAMFDDIGTKVPHERFRGLPPSWRIETSPGNFQYGFIFRTPIEDGEVASLLFDGLTDEAGLGDKGASGAMYRWARLPVGINGKEKYKQDDGKPFQCRLVTWQPGNRYEWWELFDYYLADIAKDVRARIAMKSPASGNTSARARRTPTVIDPAIDGAGDHIISSLRARGLYKARIEAGVHDITCPWVGEHTDAVDNGTRYFEPNADFPRGGFKCHHGHCADRHLRDLVEYLGIQASVAGGRPVIDIVAGDLHLVVDRAEEVLAKRGQHFQAGGAIVSIGIDNATGDPSIVPTNVHELTRELSEAAVWRRWYARAQDWRACDPSERHVHTFFEGQKFCHLPVLTGLARQPFFRETDGELVVKPGYDNASGKYGVFDPADFPGIDATPEAAREALKLLENLVAEFKFVSEIDRAAALAAMITAVVRPSLMHAPAFHVRAPASGSSKTYLCELIGAFAGPGVNRKVSYPASAEEATKVILSLLLSNPAVIEFDDMSSDWIPHGVINRMLTADFITERLLGVSKTATVGTRTLVLGSGNNVGPLRDLLRQVLTISIDPRCQTPSTLSYCGSPVDRVRAARGKYVAAVLTIVQAWRAAGTPRAKVHNIVTYGGQWSDFCRHPLIWLGLPDPAGGLLEQVRHDPDLDALNGLMTEWRAVFGLAPTTVRKAVYATICKNPNLLDAMREFSVEERGEINRTKLGWILRRNADRVVNGWKFQRCEADGRAAWRAVAA